MMKRNGRWYTSGGVEVTDPARILELESGNRPVREEPISPWSIGATPTVNVARIQYDENWAGVPPIKCRGCGGIYLHHERVEIFGRVEDASIGIHAVIDGMQFALDENMHDNPSPRRDGIIIHLRCENCQCQQQLLIHQHKGQTYVQHKLL